METNPKMIILVQCEFNESSSILDDCFKYFPIICYIKLYIYGFSDINNTHFVDNQLKNISTKFCFICCHCISSEKKNERCNSDENSSPISMRIDYLSL